MELASLGKVGSWKGAARTRVGRYLAPLSAHPPSQDSCPELGSPPTSLPKRNLLAEAAGRARVTETSLLLQNIFWDVY